jgi:hypothetical protein
VVFLLFSMYLTIFEVLDYMVYSGGEACGKEAIGGDRDVDGRIILRWIFRKWEGFVGPGWNWLRIGTGGGHL